MLRRNDLLDARAAESFKCRIGRVADPVAEKDEYVARRYVDIEFIEGRVIEWTKRQSSRLYDLCPPRMTVNGPRQTRVCDAQRSIGPVPHRIDHGNVLRADGTLGQRCVHQSQHLRG